MTCLHLGFKSSQIRFLGKCRMHRTACCVQWCSGALVHWIEVVPLFAHRRIVLLEQCRHCTCYWTWRGCSYRGVLVPWNPMRVCRALMYFLAPVILIHDETIFFDFGFLSLCCWMTLLPGRHHSSFKLD